MKEQNRMTLAEASFILRILQDTVYNQGLLNGIAIRYELVTAQDDATTVRKRLRNAAEQTIQQMNLDNL